MSQFHVKKVLRYVGWIILPGAAVVLSACSFAYQLRVTVVPGDQIGIEAIADVNIIIAKTPVQQSQSSSMMTLPVDEEGTLVTEICCSPDPDIWIYAFVDANRSGRWDSDETLVADSNNPHRLSDDYTTTLVLP
ncbi:hypothetical protein [Granulosicoccus antarcticus]|uniref:Lipoprotein n=1 Tax=Granulosicoccus antarcticus IMCC3135 TaxID=1192854 RepID=A0A2Z2NU93_9GAMM|nr:hypothetical protein [Granulosicoccus antarcticus]ASJ73298.1 hypothetical protein IMCC3135_16080 [Granulosicoccus antarcticus IMCC3135]